MSKEKILIIGSNGQIGSVLTNSLREQFGNANVIATDIREGKPSDGIFELLDISDRLRLAELVQRHHVTQIYHLAAILSAKGEANPLHTWDFNMNSLFNVLEVARAAKVAKVFFPSSIAVFGEHIPKKKTSQFAPLFPTTTYGMSKVAGELWSQYYFEKYGLDVRSLRYPGVIGWQSDPGGGTTDYAVEIFHYALQNKPYTCFLSENTRLPMIYMDDAVRATLELMDAPADKISMRTSYNIAGTSFTPAELTEAIQEEIPGLQVHYQPDFRQAIANSWSESIDDSVAVRDWGWVPAFNLKRMTKDMIFQLKNRYA